MNASVLQRCVPEPTVVLLKSSIKFLICNAVDVAARLPYRSVSGGRQKMEIAAQLGVLVVATIVAAGAAFGMAWAVLLGAFRLMEPAAARPRRRLRSEPTPRSAARGFLNS